MTYIVQCILRRRKCIKCDTKVFRTQMYILISIRQRQKISFSLKNWMINKISKNKNIKTLVTRIKYQYDKMVEIKIFKKCCIFKNLYEIGCH